jgi:PAS domain S-box-containing protein
VTERKVAERWLDRSAEKGTIAVEEPETVRITTDETGTIIIADLTAERLSGFSRDELVGKTVWSLFSGGGLRETLSREVLEGGRSAECSEGVALVRKDGSKETVHITAEPIKSAAGAVIGMICTLRKG